MPLFDANCTLGRGSIHTALDVPISVPELLAEMDRLGIAEALVHHAMAIDGHPAEGNRRLMRELADHPDAAGRLHPSWVLLPSIGEMPEPDELVAQMRAEGVRAARLCSGRHRYFITEANVGDLLAALEAHRIPLFLDYGMTRWSEELTDWRGLDSLAERYPALPLVILNEGMAAPRRLFPLWRRHANLYLETSYYQVHQGLSDIARRGYADRLLFATGLPVRAPGPALTQLRYDFLTDAERAAAGGGNLRRLLSRAYGGTDASAPDGAATFTEATELPNHPILDLHAHLDTWFSSYIHAGDAAGMVRSMDRLGIAATALIHFDAIAADMRGGNDRTAEAMRRFPGRFLGYATVDPNDPAAMLPELRRCFEELGFHAIKFHCDTHGYPADGENYRPALKYADEHGLCILIHGRITETMLREFPRAQFLSAHVGGWDGRFPYYAVELAKRFSNIHMDLSSSVAANGVLEKLVAEVGADRVVHGSDAPLMDFGYQLGRVLAAKLTPEQKEQILYRNGARLFKLAL